MKTKKATFKVEQKHLDFVATLPKSSTFTDAVFAVRDKFHGLKDEYAHLIVYKYLAR